MSSLVLIRHGQASFGGPRYDALSEAGIAQSRAIGEWLRERGAAPTAVLHGPRRRHADTAAGLLSSAGLALRQELAPALDEFAEGEEVLDAAAVLFGRPMTGAEAPPRGEQLRCYSAAYEAWSRGEIEIPGRASFTTFRGALRDWLRELTDAPGSASGQRIMAVTSAGVVAVAVCEVLGLPDAKWSALVAVMQNASLTELQFSRGRCSLRSFNGTGHLPARLSSSI